MTFPVGTMTAFERLQASSFTATATITDPKGTVVSDGAGGITKTATTVATERCRIKPMSLARSQQLFGGRFTDTIPYEVSLKPDTVVQEKHELTISGVTYDVIALWRAGTYNTKTVAVCVRK